MTTMAAGHDGKGISIPRVGAIVLVAALPLLVAAPAAAAAATDAVLGPGLDPARVEGPAACAECHEVTAEIWQRTRHHAVFRETHRSVEGTSFAKRLRIRRVKDAEGLCASCHYTVELGSSRARATAGVSCESCHGAARDWIREHSEFSGKEKETETAAEAAERWARSEAAGMIRPANLHAMAQNCHSCHAIAHEELVNVGGHPTGGEFELLAWSMGEVRHNVWYSESNDEATPERRRMLYLAGLALSLESSLTALAAVQAPDAEYAADMRARVAAARDRLAAAAEAVGDAPEMAAMVESADPSAAPEELLAAAANVATAARRLLDRDGTEFAAISFLLPSSDAYVGTAAEPAGATSP